MSRLKVSPWPTCSKCRLRPTRNGLHGYCQECQRAYARDRRHRNGARPHVPPATRFWRNVTGTDRDGCWEWTGMVNENGYGMFGRLGLAHRFSWTITSGPIPVGLWVLHHCDNRRCVRPDHLFIGDRRANTDDMLAKSRQALGARNGTAKLTEDDVREIRRLREAGLSLRKIAARFGCNDMNVHYICTRTTWRHIA